MHLVGWFVWINEILLRSTYIHKPRNTINSCYTQSMKLDYMTAVKWTKYVSCKRCDKNGVLCLTQWPIRFPCVCVPLPAEFAVVSSWNVMAHGEARKGKWRETGEWSGWSVSFTLPRNFVYPALLPLIRTPRLPVIDWTESVADLNGLVRFAERRNLVSARVPLYFKCSLLFLKSCSLK